MAATTTSSDPATPRYAGAAAPGTLVSTTPSRYIEIIQERPTQAECRYYTTLSHLLTIRLWLPSELLEGLTVPPDHAAATRLIERLAAAAERMRSH